MRTRSMRVFALLLSLLFLLTFAGCAAQTTQPEQEAAQAADEPQTAVPEADPAAIQQFSVNKENSVLIPATDYSLYPLDDGSNTLTLWYGGWSNDYVDEINELWNFKEAERVTGVHVEYTELLTNDPDGRTMMTVRAIYTGLGAAGKAWLYDWSASQIGAPDTLELTHIAWETDGAYLIPQMTTLTTEESNLVTSIVGDCSTYWEEMTLKFIVGETPLNDETWQDYVDHIYGLGIQSAIDAQQAALARYYNWG